MWSEHRFVSFDDTPIFFRRIKASGRFRAAVLIVHGMGEHGGRYKEFAEHLASKGFSCYLPDLRGFGASGGKRGCLRHFEDYFRDLSGVCRLVRSWEEDPRPFVFGHSYGGLVSASFLISDPPPETRGLVLSSPNFGIAIRVPLWRKMLAYTVSAFLPDYTQDNRVDRRTLSHDMEMLKRHEQDPLIHSRIGARLYTELNRQIGSSMKMAASIQVPVLVMQAGDDRVVSRPATEAFYEALSSADKRLKIYPGLYHEILNETTRQSLYSEIADWLSDRA